MSFIFLCGISVEFSRDIYMKVMVQDIETSVLIFLLRLKEMKTLFFILIEKESVWRGPLFRYNLF